jgi:DNA replication regulator DPB11
MAAMSRVPEGKLRFWESLLGPRGFQVTPSGGLQRSPGKDKARKPVYADEEEQLPPMKPSLRNNNRSVIPAFRAGNSFAPEKSKPKAVAEASTSATTDRPLDGSDLFSGLRFQVLGEARSANVQKAIEGAGGKYVSPDNEDMEGEPDFIIVRLVRWARRT